MATFLMHASRACGGSARTFGSLSVVRPPLKISSRWVASRLLASHVRRQASGLASARLPLSPTNDLPSNDDQPTFSSLNSVISSKLLKALTESPMKLTHMSAVQTEVLPLLPELARPYDPKEPPDSPPRDLLVRAKTGTGKTLAFLVPAVEARLADIERHVRLAARDVGREGDRSFEKQAALKFARENVGTLIISPTRELANQIAAEALRLTDHLPGFGVRVLVGGESKREQLRGWTYGRRDIVVGTAGRLRDLLMSEPEVKRGMSQTRVLVLDEADTLLDMGFRDDIEAIKEFLPPVPERQTFLFSATVSPNIQQIARSTLAPNHKFINCISGDSSPVHAHVAQYHTVLSSGTEQIPYLLRLIAHDQLTNPGASKIIVFLPTTKMTQLFATIVRETSESTLPAGRRTRVFELHSKRRMESRTNTSDTFRADRSGASVLITSDVSARGVDYPAVSRVIQVGIPAGTEQYIHRIGRTGRANTQGRGDLVLLPWEMDFVNTSLSDLPLKPLMAKDLISQVQKLAKTFDENPSGFFVNAPTAPPPRIQSGSNRPASNRPRHDLFQKQVTAVVDDVQRITGELLGKLDEEAIRETFMSLLGYYVSRTAEMRLSKAEVVEGCKSWAVEAGGLVEAPYVSPRFLQQIGVGNERPRKMFGMKNAGGGIQQSSWAERGRQRLKRDNDLGERRQDGHYRRQSFGDRDQGSSWNRGRSEGSRGDSSFGRRSESGRGGSKFRFGGRESERDSGGRDRRKNDSPW